MGHVPSARLAMGWTTRVWFLEQTGIFSFIHHFTLTMGPTVSDPRHNGIYFSVGKVIGVQS